MRILSYKVCCACVIYAFLPSLSGLLSAAQTLDPGMPPGRNFNLTNFYLGLPVDSSGGTTGNSASVPAAQLTGGYSNALYFYTGPDGAMTFWAPVTGATTSGSDYPRSELREQISPPLNSSNWTSFGRHILKAQCRVTQLPSTGKVIIGQIHSYLGAARPLVKLQCYNGAIEALIKTNDNYSGDHKLLFGNVGLNNLVDYTIQMENGLLNITVNQSNKAFNVFETGPNWATNTHYFKAGSYCQDNSGSSAEGARVSFYGLSRSHAPSITNQPQGALINQNQHATFAISATGNGPLRYQWRFNHSDLSDETNSSLTIASTQPHHAGTYTVRVRDNLGVVTSALAMLDFNQVPILGAFSAATGQEVPLTIPFTDLIERATDPEGQVMVISGAASASQMGGTVAVTHSALLFTPASGYFGPDEISYTIRDAPGATAQGKVSISVISSNSITLTPSRVDVSAVSFSASFNATPGLRYAVDTAANPAGPWDLGITSILVPPSGILELSVETTAGDDVRFYRIRYP